MALRDNFAELGAADFAPDSVAVPLPERRPTGRDFSAGVRRGARGLESALRAVAGDTAGAKYAAAQAAAVPARFQSYEDISSPGDAVDYAQQTLGEQVPNLGLMAAGGGLGGLGARAAFGRAAQAAGARIGASQASAAAQGGEMINELRGQGLQPDAFTAGAAELAGVLDVAGLEGLGRGLVASATREAAVAGAKASATKRVLLGAAAGAARGLAAEEPAELAQEGLAIANRIHAQPEYAKNTEDMARRLKETAVATAVVGGVPGAAAGTIGGLRANTTPEHPESSQSAPVPEMRPQNTDPVRMDGDAAPPAEPGRPEAPAPEDLEAGPADPPLGADVSGEAKAPDTVPPAPPPPSTSAEYQAELDAMQDPESSRDSVLITPHSDGRISPESIPENTNVVDAGPAGTLVTTNPAKAAAAQDEVAQTGALSAETQGRLLFNGAADGIPESGNAEVIGRNAEGVQATNIVVDTQQPAATQRAVDEAAAQNPGGSVEVQPITPETTASHLANLQGAIHGQESPQAPHAAETGQRSLLDQEVGALAQQDEAPSISYDFNPDDEDPTSVNPFADHLSVTGGPSGRVETQFAQHNVVRPLRTLYPGVEITPPSKAGPGRASIEFPDRAVRQDSELHSASMFHAIRGAFEFGKKDRGAIVVHLPGEEGKAKFHINPRGLEAIGRQIPGHTDDPAINAMAGLGLLQAKGFTFPELKAAKNPDAWIKKKLGRQEYPYQYEDQRPSATYDESLPVRAIHGQTAAFSNLEKPKDAKPPYRTSRVAFNSAQDVGLPYKVGAGRADVAIVFEDTPGKAPYQPKHSKPVLRISRDDSIIDAANKIRDFVVRAHAKGVYVVGESERARRILTYALRSDIDARTVGTSPEAMTSRVGGESGFDENSFELQDRSTRWRPVSQDTTDPLFLKLRHAVEAELRARYVEQSLPGGISEADGADARFEASLEDALSAVGKDLSRYTHVRGGEVVTHTKTEAAAKRELTRRIRARTDDPAKQARIRAAHEIVPSGSDFTLRTKREARSATPEMLRDVEEAIRADRAQWEREDFTNREERPSTIEEDANEDFYLEAERKRGDYERAADQAKRDKKLLQRSSSVASVSALPALGTRVSTPRIRTTQEVPAAPGPSNQDLIAQLEADRASLQALSAKMPLDEQEREHLSAVTRQLNLLRAAGDVELPRTETREVTSPSVPERVTRFVQKVYDDLGLKLNTQIIAQRDLEQRIRMLEAGDEDARLEAQSLREALSDQSFAARTIYNQHYRDVGRRTPVIVLSEHALKGKWAPILTHEIGHVVARAWYDGLSPELQAHLFDELTDGGKYPDSFEETFAEKFVEWYRNRSSLTGRLKDAMNSLYAQLRKLWASVSRQEREFRAKYPKFDEFLSSMVGIHGKMPVLSRSTQEVWAKNLANPYAGLPLQIGAVKFHDMSVEEAYTQGLTQWNAAKNWADTRMKTAVGQNQVAERYYRKAKENADGIKRMSRLVFMPDAARVRQYLPEFADLIAPLPGKEMKATAVIPPTNIGGGVPAGTRSMTAPIHTAVKRTLAHWMPEVDKILGMLPTKPVATIGGKSWGKWIDTAHPDYQATVDGLIDALPYDQLTPAAKEIRKYFRRMLAYMHGRGVRVGQLQNYFPRMWDLVGLDDNKAEVIDTFEKIFAARSELPVRQDSHGNTVLFRDAREAAEFEYNRIMTGAVDSLFSLDPAAEDSGLRGQSFRFARSRTFSDDEYRQFGLNRWVSRDLVNILNTYTRLGVRRAVWQWATGIPKDQRVGRRGEYWKQRFEAAGLDPAVMGSPVAAVELRMAEMARDGEIGADDYRELMTKRLPALFGTLSVGANPALRKWTGRLLMYETLRTMAWSTFASFGDLGVAAWRGESVGLALKSMRELISAEDRKTQLGLLKAIGLYLDDFTDHALMMDMTSGDPLAGGSQKITQLFFHANGMHKLSQATLMFASRLGQNYIRAHGEKAAAGDATSLKRLKELHPDLTPQVATDASFESDPTLQLALHKFVNEAHIHDQQGLTPWWFSDIRFKLLAQLKSFQFKYWHLVGRLMWERMKERPTLYGAAVPLAAFFVATAPLAALGLETKEFLRRGLLPEVKRAPKPPDMQEKMWRVFMAVQPNIYLALGETAHDASSHGQAAVTALAGPTVSHAMMVMSRTADEFIPQSVPIVAQVPWLRAGVRGALRENFGLGVRDDEE